MKSLKIISMAACCAAALVFNACTENDSPKSLTKEEVKAAFETVKGTYKGSVIFPATNPKNAKDVTDTLDVNWTIATDSVMTIDNLPAQALVPAISDEALGKALAQQQAQSMKCYIGFYSVSPACFLINPKGLTYKFAYGTEKKEHDVVVAFYGNNSGSLGAYNATNKTLQMQIVAGGVYIDGKLQPRLIKKATPLLFKATKK